jgi:hypothetical protein
MAEYIFISETKKIVWIEFDPAEEDFDVDIYLVSMQIFGMRSNFSVWLNVAD